ncbi:MAG: ATP-dependent DNA helicase [Candidatus Uhrbacteria bacterium]
MSEGLLDGLNPAQLEAVTHGTGPLLIVAGAGTGKTTVLTKRYAYLLQQEGVSEENILALTFTDKSAGEMEDRVISLLETGAYDFWISTFHGFCQRVIEAHGLEIGLPNQFRLLTPVDSWLMLKRRFTELPLEHYRPLGNPVKFLRAILNHISRAKDEGITPEQYLAFAESTVLEGEPEAVESERKRLLELANVYAVYRKMMLEEGCLDFADLILETLRLFRERPSVLELYRKQFQYLMVDEFQDTNWAQYELIKLLCGKERNITVVGDDDQAIYKFRGASLANILQFRDDFPDAKTVALTQNYRSKKEILDCAYNFIKKNNPNRLEVKLADTGLTKQLEATRGDGGHVGVIWKRGIEDEAEAVAYEIKRLKDSEPDTSWNEFAILVRGNDSAEPFVNVFESMGIPYQFLALRGLYAKPAVLDVQAILHSLDGYHESSAIWRLMHLGCYNVPSKDVAELLHYAGRKGLSLWSALRQASEAAVSRDGLKIVQKLVEHIEALAETARRERPLRSLQLALDKTGYLAWVMRLPEQDKCEYLQHLNGFAERMKRYEHSTHGPSLRGFLEELRIEIDSGEEGGLDFDPDAGPELVKIMTVHASKGLEFKHVFVASMVDRKFPSRARSEAIPLPEGLIIERLPVEDAHLEEERRLFYVAMTRAKDRLYLTGAVQYGGTRPKKPSVFLNEAGLAIPEPTGGDEAKRLMLQDPDELVESDVAHYELKKRFSFTQLAAFRKCPLQYKFEHIYRIPKFGTYQKSFGQSVHNAYQHILELHQLRTNAQQGSLFGPAPESGPEGEGFKVTLEEAYALYDEAWIDEWYETRERHDEYKEKGRGAIKHFWQSCRENLPQIFGVEIPFTLVLGLHSLKGKVDRVDKLPDGSVVVYDYKTGQAKDELSAEDKEQLHLYQLALEEKGIKVSRLAYIYVLDWVITDVDLLKEEKRDAFLNKITERMEAITLSKYEPTSDPFTCKYCDFKGICEFRKL